MNWVGLRKRFGNADWKWMQKSTAPYIKQFSRNNNSQLSTEILGAFFVLELIDQTKRDEGGGYKRM